MTAPSLRGRALLAALYTDLPGTLELRAIAREGGVVGQVFVDPADARAIAAFMRRYQVAHVYFGVALRKDDTSGALANCAVLPALFADVDFKQYAGGEDEARAALLRAAFPPTAVVASGGGLHAYWKLKEPLDLSTDADAAKALLRRLAGSLGADLASAEPAHVLRLPNTVNVKYDPPRKVVLELLDADREYNPSDFDELLPADPGPAAASAAVAEGETIREGGRNRTLTSRAGVLRRRHFSPDAIEAALQVENRERCDPPLPEEEVRTIARSIGRKRPAEEEPGGPVTDASEEPVDERLAEELERERARREARRRLDAEERGPIADPEILTLRDWLAVPESPTRWRIAGWQPAGSRIMLPAQFKAGKTTALHNLIRSLVDGEAWLGDAAVEPVPGAVVVLDFEMSRHQLRLWLREQRVRHDDRVCVVPLRGQAASFDILEPATRARWAGWLRAAGAAYLILDCLRPVLDALGLDESHDAGRFLVAFDALLIEAGVPEALVVHHMGHVNERARGDSRLRDWPDAEWRLVRQTDDPGSARFISAYGRDVDIPEAQLRYDSSTRRLTLIGGSRRDAKVREALPVVLAAIDDAEVPPGVRELERACGSTDHPRDRIRAAIRLGIEERAIETQKGKGGKVLHFRASTTTPRGCAEVRGECAAHTGARVRGVPALFREPHARTHSGTPEPDPTWVTDPTPPDAMDPVGSRDENPAPADEAYVFEVDP